MKRDLFPPCRNVFRLRRGRAAAPALRLEALEDRNLLSAGFGLAVVLGPAHAPTFDLSSHPQQLVRELDDHAASRASFERADLFGDGGLSSAPAAAALAHTELRDQFPNPLLLAPAAEGPPKAVVVVSAAGVFAAVPPPETPVAPTTLAPMSAAPVTPDVQTAPDRAPETTAPAAVVGPFTAAELSQAVTATSAAATATPSASRAAVNQPAVNLAALVPASPAGGAPAMPAAPATAATRTLAPAVAPAVPAPGLAAPLSGVAVDDSAAPTDDERKAVAPSGWFALPPVEPPEQPPVPPSPEAVRDTAVFEEYFPEASVPSEPVVILTGVATWTAQDQTPAVAPEAAARGGALSMAAAAGMVGAYFVGRQEDRTKAEERRKSLES
jgi:hypothetical protein